MHENTLEQASPPVSPGGHLKPLERIRWGKGGMAAVVMMVSKGQQKFTLCLGEGVLRPFLHAHMVTIKIFHCTTDQHITVAGYNLLNH